ncbi:hypothetical protein [Nocardia thailandica]|uniref:ESX-1 secretion-associated protein EspA/EspE-like domain-containing protein n=1 Tax=Nocardia thailandica TaxID=257275 RepID=A0ABW6PPQ4_9NOCA
MTELTKQLNSQITTIRTNIDDIGNLPNKVDEFCGALALSMRSNYASISGIFSAYGTEKAISDMYEDRDNVNAAIREAWTKLDATDPDLEVPVQLLTISDEWRNFKGLVQAARADFDNTDLSQNWAGDAAAAYVGVRNRQKLALESVPLACEQIAVSLGNLASSELTLYIELAQKTREMVTEVTALVGGLTSSTVKIVINPWDIAEYVDSMSNLAVTMENLKTLIMGVVSAMATNSAAKIAENNMIGQSYSIIDGLHNNKWPTAVSAAHTGGLRDVIGDATTTDEDKSDWEPGTTVVVATS